MNTIDPEVKSLLSNYDDAKCLWDDLHERFSLVNGPRIQQLKSEIAKCIQTPTMTVAVYYGKLSMLWDELDKHEPLISYTCRKCECNVGKQHATRRDSDRLHQFLLGLLPDLYGSLRSVLLSQDPLPTLNRAFQTISQEERMRGIDRAKENIVESTGFTVRTSPRPPPRIIPQLSKAEKKALFCSHCKKSGHDVTMCFDLLGEIPDWWYELKSAKPKQKGSRGTSTRVWSSRGDVGNGTNAVHAVAADAPTTSGSQSQDLSTRTVIGMGDRLDGLYYLRPENNLVANTVDVVSSLTLWHHRLGHTSVKFVKLLLFLSNTSSDLS
ncbi:hypothetical protein RND81_08G169900 [Saponaria officinalis]|uniref:Retrotransposon gag domain-containing protein n=1 Tax=Saponaria officinalis TaxID=3572 RepID=A0AAW1J8N4_SAPOF